MRVDRVVVDPVPLGSRQTVQIQLAHGNHGVVHLAVDGVAVDVERVRELVVGLDRLQLRECRRHDARVDDADARDGGGVVSQLTLAGRGRGLVLLGLRRGQPVGRPGGLDVPIDVWRL